MVLADLGAKITGALQKLRNSSVLDESVVAELVKTLSLALLQADVDVHLVKQMKVNIQKQTNLDDMPAGANKRKMVQSIVVRELMNLLDPGVEPFQPVRKQANVIMFVGLQGSGKTTSCTKLAYYYKRKGWKVGLVCADTFRAGAYDQLKQNATKAKIPFYGSYTEVDPAVVAEDGVRRFRDEGYEIIIVDTSGRHKQEEALFEEMKQVAEVTEPDDVIFVMDSSIGQAAKPQAEAFRDAVDVGSVIITKLDGHAKGGGALSAVAATHSPIIFVGTGEHIHEFERFNPKSFVSRLLGMGDLDALLDIMANNEAFDPEEQRKLMEKISKEGKFSFRDMQMQFQSLMSMGPIGQVMSMIPGLGNIMGKDHEDDAQKRIVKFMNMMDSMTDEELDGDTTLLNRQPTRCVRIARGSGCTVSDVDVLKNAFKPFQKLAQKMKGIGNKKIDPTKASSARQLQNMFGPQMMQQLGGMGNIQKMMAQMGGGRGMPGGFPGFGNM